MHTLSFTDTGNIHDHKTIGEFETVAKAYEAAKAHIALNRYEGVIIDEDIEDDGLDMAVNFGGSSLRLYKTS